MRELGIPRRSLHTRELRPLRSNRGLHVSSAPVGREVHVGSPYGASRLRFHAEAQWPRQTGRCAHRGKCGLPVQLASRLARERDPHQPEHRCGRPPLNQSLLLPELADRRLGIESKSYCWQATRDLRQEGFDTGPGADYVLTDAALLGAGAHVQHHPCLEERRSGGANADGKAKGRDDQASARPAHV